MMLSAKRLGAFAAAGLISAGALLGFDAAAANATPQFCEGNYLCVNVASQTFSTLYFHFWAAKYRFVGHFELQTPEHTTYNSSDGTQGPSHGPTFAVPIVYGTYCGQAWRANTNGTYTNLGSVCFTAGA